MGREAKFLIYCMERYRYYKGLSGEIVSKIFEENHVYTYIMKYFEALHTMGDQYIVQDIDDYIENMKSTSETGV